MSEQILKWYELTENRTFALPTGDDHVIKLQREVIPVLFVPGIMGTRLARNGTAVWDPKGDFDDGSTTDFLFSDGPERKAILIGPGDHDPDYLQVDLGAPEEMPGGSAEQRQLRFDRGWGGLLASSYHGFMQFLDGFLTGGTLQADFGRYFEFPLYGMGYNWTADNDISGQRIAARVNEIIDQHNNSETLCEKIIFITHSMGGLASRSAMKQHGIEGKVIGVIHGVQPVTGGPAAYKRVRAGFGGSWTESNFLGPDAAHVTPIFANSPGALELLPSTNHRDNSRRNDWFRVLSDGNEIFTLPAVGDPYDEIYLQRTTWWRLVDETLIDPARNGQSRGSPQWTSYVSNLGSAKSFHNSLGLSKHANTYQIWGSGTVHPTFDNILYDLEIDYTWPNSNAPLSEEMITELQDDPTAQASTSQSGMTCTLDLGGEQISATIRDASGQGDGTVPAGSGMRLSDTAGNRAVANIGHEPAYNDAAVRTATTNAMTRILKDYFETKIGGP